MTVVAGKYEVERELGQGASGTVYLVKHTDLGINYALKILDKSLCDQKFIDRFKREAEVLSRFTDPGSVQLRDFGKTEEGGYYMAMDYCPGTTLKKVIEDHGEIPVRRALHIMEQLLTTLDAAHRAGIIHRDIKPENIMLLRDENGKDVVKVLDFGIAKLREREMTSGMTMEGAAIGTPQYMSPEQASGEANLDHRVDLYAAGVALYEMVTGAPPFVGTTVIQTLIMHLTQPPAPFAEAFGFPEFVESLVLKALEKNRDERFQTAAEFREACSRVMQLLSKNNQAPIELSPEPESQTPLVAESEPVVSKTPTKILCLDDSDMILHIMKHILEEQGYIVYTANNSSAVHQYLFSEGVELLVTDVQMPDLPGTKVCRMLKKSLPSLKVVLFSNLPDRELDKLSTESKADGWISKNTKPKEWLDKIVEVLGEGAPSETTPSQ